MAAGCPPSLAASTLVTLAPLTATVGVAAVPPMLMDASPAVTLVTVPVPGNAWLPAKLTQWQRDGLVLPPLDVDLPPLPERDLMEAAKKILQRRLQQRAAELP